MISVLGRSRNTTKLWCSSFCGYMHQNVPMLPTVVTNRRPRYFCMPAFPTTPNTTAVSTASRVLSNVAYPDGSKYTGELVDGLRNGYGKLQFADGAVYEGSFLHHKQNGYGTLTENDGTVYKCNWVDGVQNGYGTKNLPNGNSYKGDFANGLYNGKGTYKYKSGKVYIGEFKDRLYHGQGKMMYVGGAVYEGPYVNDKSDGQAVVAHGSAQNIPKQTSAELHSFAEMYFNSVYEEVRSPRGTELFSPTKLFQNNSHEKKRRTEFSEEHRPQKHPRSSSEGSFFLHPSDPSSILSETVNNYAVDISELELVDCQLLAANLPTETVFQFVPLDKPLKDSELASPKERIDSFSASKLQCNVGLSCETDFDGNIAHVFTSPSVLSTRVDEKNAHPSNPPSAFSERSQHFMTSSAQSKSWKAAKVNYHTLDSFESKTVPAQQRTGYECGPRSSPEKIASRLVVSTEFEDCDENECDNCTTVESSSVSCQSRRGGGMSCSNSVARSEARSEVSVDRSWAQKQHSSTSYRNRQRSYLRGASERRNSWVSAAPASACNNKVVPYHDSSSGASCRSTMSRRSEGRRNEKHQHLRSRSKEKHPHVRNGLYQVSDRNSRDHSPRTSYGTGPTRSSAHSACRSRSSSRTSHPHDWSTARSTSSYTSSRGMYSAAYTSSSRVSTFRGTYSERLLEDLPLEWWERSEDCKDAKARHTDRIDHICDSREDLVLKTTLWKENTVLEPNMFPYSTPYGVEHHTLWSIHELTHHEIVAYVDNWLLARMPHVRRWQYDDNSGERSINLFHVHIFIETVPYSFAPRAEMLYVPPHAQMVDVESKEDL